jgi:predicted phage-related endonuclease
MSSSLEAPSIEIPDWRPDGRVLPFHTSDQWHDFRRLDLTASSIAGAFGQSRWSSAYSDYVYKLGLATPPGESDIMRAGRFLEDGIAKMLACEQEWDLHDIPAFFAAKMAIPSDEIPLGFYLRDPESRLGATPDRVIRHSSLPGGEGPLEIKNVSWFAFRDDWEGEEAPVKYWIQLQVQLGLARLAGLPWRVGTIGCLVAGNDARTLRYEFDPQAFEVCQDEARRFWKLVETGREPDPDFTNPATIEAIKRRWVKSKPDVLDLRDNREAQLIAAAVQEARTVQREAAKTEKIELARLLTFVKDHETVLLPDGWTVTGKTQSRKAYTVKESTFRPIKVTPGDAIGPEASTGDQT